MGEIPQALEVRHALLHGVPPKEPTCTSDVLLCGTFETEAHDVDLPWQAAGMHSMPVLVRTANDHEHLRGITLGQLGCVLSELLREGVAPKLADCTTALGGQPGTHRQVAHGLDVIVGP